MIRRLYRSAARLSVLALLVNLAAHATSGAAMAAVGAAQPGGPVIVICSPEGLKRLVWTPDGFVPLPGDAGEAKQSCPFCSLAAVNVVLPDSPACRLPWATVEIAILSAPSPQPVSLPGFSIPPVRAPPVFV
ncbi:DUF2946 family protein [Algihabitans albus]|uniref:DUF2946 family protein n=1 Tax=Algihabitans albus TaxID=2164067 RepID=UPI0013C2CCF1|nr:DUF2946 family protein [Algihabitans albus]